MKTRFQNVSFKMQLAPLHIGGNSALKSANANGNGRADDDSSDTSPTNSETSQRGSNGGMSRRGSLTSLCENSTHNFASTSISPGASGHGRNAYAQLNEQHTGASGTFRYMAPEVTASQSYNTSCDVFSYGVLVWEILSHAAPFKVLTPREVGDVHVACTLPVA